jgi:uncharacterized repeat protein (TIGR01451 family)
LSGSSLTIDPADSAVTCTWTNTRTTTLVVTKTSSVVTDGVSGANPKALPFATVRYCILASNTGTAAAGNVTALDTLPANVAFISGTMRSGSTCAGAATVEDDNNSGTDESDPVGASITGSTITGLAPTLAAGSSFALTFDVQIQ